MMKKQIVTMLAVTLTVAGLQASDWSQWGGSSTRNMVSPEKGLPTEMNAGKKVAKSEEIDIASTKNCLWVA
jgi:hypothetical protein